MWKTRGTVIDPVGLKTPFRGSNISAAAMNPPEAPPTIKTLPSGRIAATCSSRIMAIGPTWLVKALAATAGH